MLKNPTWINPGEEWKDSAACRHEGPEMFFYETSKDASTPSIHGRSAEYRELTIAAAALCGTCAVQQECLDYALVNNEAHGVWGGVSVSMRKSMRRAHARSEALTND